MTLTGPPASTLQPQALPTTHPSTSRLAVLARCVTSPLLTVLLVLGLLALAAGGAFIAFGTTSGHVHKPFQQIVGPYQKAFPSPATSPNDLVNDPDLAGLFVRGQPMRWTQAQTRAVAEKDAGKNYIKLDDKSAMKAA
jgi:hypothetical protein